MLTPFTVYLSGAVREHSAVQVIIEGFDNLIPQASILMLEPGLPLELEVIPGMVDDLVEGRSFSSSPSPTCRA